MVRNEIKWKILELKFVWQSLEESLRNMERAVSHLSPEVLVLFQMLFCSRCITDDAEADEGNFIQMAYLGDGSRLHINSQSFREIRLDGFQFLAVSDELVTATDQSSVDSCFRIQADCTLVESLVAGKVERKSWICP